MAQRFSAAAIVLGTTLGIVLCVPLIAAAATGTTTTTSTTAANTATALYKSAITAAKQQKSLHFLAKSTESGRSVTIKGASSATAGTEQVLMIANKSTGHVTGRLVNKVVYFKGDTFGLEEYLGMPATLAPKYAGKWIFFSPATKSYAAIAQAFTPSAAVGQISMKGPYSKTPSTVNGQAATLLTGRNTATGKKGKKGSATLAVASTGTPLPIRFQGKGTVSKKAVTERVDYSGWGSPVSPKTPQGAIPASTITSST